MLENQFGQRFETFFSGDGGAGAAFRLVGQVKVFEFGFGNRPLDLLAQFVGQFALFVDRAENRYAAGFQRVVVSQFFLNVQNFDFIEIAVRLLAVTGDEGHGGTFGEQFGDGGDLPGGNSQVFGNERDGIKQVLLGHRLNQFLG